MSDNGEPIRCPHILRGNIQCREQWGHKTWHWGLNEDGHAVSWPNPPHQRRSEKKTETVK